jgi:hypothetical protein
MTVQEMARTMIMDSKLTDIFWTQVVHIEVHIQNRVILRNNTNKTPFELCKGRGYDHVKLENLGLDNGPKFV